MVVCLDKRKGGLGDRCLSTLNMALLCKWSWCYVVESEAFWEQVIGRKFRVEEGGWSTRAIREGYGVGLWKEISKEGFFLVTKLGSQWVMEEE